MVVTIINRVNIKWKRYCLRFLCQCWLFVQQFAGASVLTKEYERTQSDNRTIYGYVYLEYADPIEGVKVQATWNPVDGVGVSTKSFPVRTDSDGNYDINIHNEPENGNVTVSFVKFGYSSKRITVENVDIGENKVEDVELIRVSGVYKLKTILDFFDSLPLSRSILGL